MKKILVLPLILLAGAAGAAYLVWDRNAPSRAETLVADASDAETVTIWRDPGCGCCDAYAEYLHAEGFEVTVIDDRNFVDRSVEAGVPEQGIGCHLAMVDGYVVSGLVPSDIIGRLLEERPGITGITLPGMPANAPGMAPEKTGTLKIYSFGPDGVGVYSDE